MILKKTHIKLYSWEHHHFYHLERNNFWERLFNIFYPNIDAVICLNKEEAGYFQQIGCKTYVIPNFVFLGSRDRSSLDNKKMLTVGWLSKTKGADLIPKIAERVFKEYPDWTWKIIGDGEEKIDDRAFDDFLQWCKPVRNIEKEYMSSSIYILPSRFECFPMVLLEAMSFGIPCIAFDCPTGPRHIIENDEDGILIEQGNVQAMASAIIDLIENEKKRRSMGAKAFENIKRFSPETIYLLWENLFNDNVAADSNQ